MGAERDPVPRGVRRIPQRPPDRLAQRAPERRAHIIRQAVTLFATQGFSATTVRQIADASGLMSGSLYHHFPSKEAILLDAMETFFTATSGRHRAATEAGADPVTRLRGLVRGSLEVIAARPELARVVVAEARRLSRTPRLGWLAERGTATAALWTRVVRDGVRAGQLRADMSPALMALLLQSAVWGMAQWYSADGRLAPDQAAEHLVDQFVFGLASPGLRPRRNVPELLGLDYWAAARRLAATGHEPTPACPDPGVDLDLETLKRLPPDASARRRIHVAAGVLFARHGFAATRVRQIAELAGVPTGSVSHHIGSKEQLLADMLGAFLKDLQQQFARDATGSPAPLRRIESLIRLTVEAYGTHGVTTVLVLNELPRADLQTRRAGVTATWTAALEAGLLSGEVRGGVDVRFAQQVLRTTIAIGSEACRQLGVADVAGLFQEVALSGLGRPRSS